jgi:hypothetical protein
MKKELDSKKTPKYSTNTKGQATGANFKKQKDVLVP